MKGKCLCERITIEVADNSNFDACHCNKCRRWGSGPFLSIDCGSDVTISGNEYISRYQSSKFAERGFCSYCGTHLFYYFIAAEEYFLSLGIIEADIDFNFNCQIFFDNKPDYYQFADSTQVLTDQEVYESFDLADGINNIDDL